MCRHAQAIGWMLIAAGAALLLSLLLRAWILRLFFGLGLTLCGCALMRTR